MLGEAAPPPGLSASRGELPKGEPSSMSCLTAAPGWVRLCLLSLLVYPCVPFVLCAVITAYGWIVSGLQRAGRRGWRVWHAGCMQHPLPQLSGSSKPANPRRASRKPENPAEPAQVVVVDDGSTQPEARAYLADLERLLAEAAAFKLKARPCSAAVDSVELVAPSA